MYSWKRCEQSDYAEWNGANVHATAESSSTTVHHSKTVRHSSAGGINPINRIAELLPWNIGIGYAAPIRVAVRSSASVRRQSFRNFLRLARIGIDFLPDHTQCHFVQIDRKCAVELGKLRP